MKNNRLLILGVTAMIASGTSAEVTLSDVIGDSPLYGYMINDTKATAKWDKINADGTITTIWQDDNRIQNDVQMLSGWMKDGVLCGFGLQKSGIYAIGFGYMERNVVSGEVYSQDIVRYSVVPKEKSFNSAVYQAEDNTIYGYGSTSNGMAFKKTAGNGDFRSTEDLFMLSDPYEWCPSLCIDYSTGQIYGITLGQNESMLLSIDEEGFSDVIATLPVKSGRGTSALAYFPETGYFLWSNLNKGVSALYAIKLSDGSCEKIYDLGTDDNYSFFVTDTSADGVGTPAMPEMVKVDFQKASTSGSIEYKLPVNDLTGVPLSGELEWTAMLDKATFKTGKANPGETVRIEYTNLEEGLHTFGLYVMCNDRMSGTARTTYYLGYDRPLAPTDLSLTLESDMKIVAEWNAVTAGVNGGYIDLDDVEYKVYLNEDYVATVKETTWSGNLNPNAPLTANVVTVIATSHGLDSGSAESNAVVAGKPMEPDVYFAPTAKDALLMTYPLDGNKSWQFNTSFEPPVFSATAKYGSDEPLNTWLIFPPIEFSDVSKTYCLNYKNGTYATYDDEYYEIWIGKEPKVEAMTTNILPRTLVAPTNSFEMNWNEVTTEFNVPEKGVWYIGFKACSDAHKTGQVLLDIRVSTLSGISDTVLNEESSVSAYYDMRGVRLSKRPSEGLYIIVYADGRAEKCLARP